MVAADNAIMSSDGAAMFLFCSSWRLLVLQLLLLDTQTRRNGIWLIGQKFLFVQDSRG